MMNTSHADKKTVLDPEPLLRDFETKLDLLRSELSHNLAALDLLQTDRLKGCLEAFNDRVVLGQREFLNTVATLSGEAGGQPERCDVESRSFHHAPEAAAAITGGVGVTQLAGHAVFETVTQGMLWWKTTTEVTFAAKIGALLGIPAGPAGIVLGAASAFVCYKATRAGTAGLQRQWLRRRILRQYDLKVRPQLRSWAQQVLSNDCVS